jgi:hypothetical protein
VLAATGADEAQLDIGEPEIIGSSVVFGTGKRLGLFKRLVAAGQHPRLQATAGDVSQ